MIIDFRNRIWPSNWNAVPHLVFLDGVQIKLAWHTDDGDNDGMQSICRVKTYDVGEGKAQPYRTGWVGGPEFVEPVDAIERQARAYYETRGLTVTDFEILNGEIFSVTLEGGTLLLQEA